MSKISEEKRREIIAAYLNGKTQKEVAEECGVCPVTAWRYISAAGLSPGTGGNQAKQMKITDDELREACKTMSRLEIAEKYKMHPDNLSRRMRKIGCYAQKVRSDGKSVWSGGGGGGRKPKGWHFSEEICRTVKENQPQFEYIESNGRQIRMRCKDCGQEIERNYSSVRKSAIPCRICKEAQKELQGERKRLLDALVRLVEIKTPKICQKCGKVFYSPYPDQKYCDQKCRKRAKQRGSTVRRRCRRYGALYAPGISLRAVYERDGGICQICGKPTNWNDHSWHDSFGALYPTIDHRVALANGGSHTWDNVQLAHAICNSYKRDLEEYDGEIA